MRGGRNRLLVRRRVLNLPLSWAFHPGLFLPAALGWCGRSLFAPLLKMLADCLVARLVTVMLLAQLLLLFDLSGIPVSRIPPLVDGKRGACRS